MEDVEADAGLGNYCHHILNRAFWEANSGELSLQFCHSLSLIAYLS